MPDVVVGTARVGVTRLAGILAQHCRFALPGAYLASVLGVCSPQVVYGAEAEEEAAIEVVVTGTRLGSANATSPSPVVVLDGEELLHLGTPRAEDLLNSLPQVNSGLTLAANGASVAPLTGTATADLRGIGAFRTLVLINGRRTAPGDPINPSADLNTIPSALVKRVEVLTGGASAIYGSDAVAGVVNFILDTSFTGFKLDVEGSINRGSNDHGDLQAIERASGVTPPTGTVYDGSTQDVSAVFGKDLFGGSAHVTAYAGYRHTHEVAGSSRDFSACTFTETGTSFQCLLDGTTALGQFVPPNGGTPLTLDTVNGHAFRPLVPGDLFNPAPYQDLQRPDTRYIAGAFANYKFSDAANLYTEAQYMDDRTTVRYEPAGTTPTSAGLNTFPINCNNPLLSANQVAALCAGLLPTDTPLIGLGRRNVEGGQRSDEFHHRSFRIVLGLKGAISTPWSYDASLVYGRINERETLSNDFSLARVTNALDVVSVNGVPTCQSVVNGSDPACVPYNIFAVGGVTPAALNYISAGGMQSGYAQRTIGNALVTGDLTHYGIVSPLAHAGFGIVAGVEYRVESVHYYPDSAYSTGDLLVTGAAHPTSGTFRVGEIFTELKMPLIEDRPFAKQLILNASDRYAHYSPQGNVNAFGLGLEWAPIDPVRLRGSVSRAVRAPNAYELFTSQILGQITITDPCAGPITPAMPTPAQCALTGVSPTQYGHIAPQSAVNVLTGGNPHLRPETADTFTAGIVLTPLSNILFSADYWRIKVKQFIGNVPGTFSLGTCLNSGDPFYCSLIQRDANGSLSTGNGTSAGRVVSTRFNTGSYGNSGVDFEARYIWSLQSIASRAGSLSFGFTGSLAIDNPINVTPGVAQIDCTDLYGPNCSGAGPTSPVPRWRHRLRTTWETRAGLEVSLNWRHIGAMKSEFTSAQFMPNSNVFPVDSHISAYDYLDVDGAIEVTEHFKVRLGVNNLTDRKPPVIGFAANPLLVNGNMAAGVYDALGRYLFAGLTAKF
jgi:iron complex outermembrane receptor protein